MVAEVSLQETMQISVLINDGTGGFALAALPGGNHKTMSIAAGDFNLDGSIGIVVGN